ncbi:MAG: LysR family transcriptional regulator [Chloroflexota bacterium]|nr:LysR family transcriptional regulator [Chloroflexota bacterium]
MLDIRRMRMLREVARLGSFGAAAHALSFTPSAVWQQMAALERESGAQLFERGPSGTRLTHAGETLLGHAEVVIDRLDRAEGELAAMTRGQAGRMLFGSFPTATESFVAAALASFQARHPRVETQFVDGEPYEHVLRLEALELDCAVIFDLDEWPAARAYDGRLVSDRDALPVEPLFDDPYLIALPTWHPLAAHDQIAVADLVGKTFIGSGAKCAPWGPELARLCRKEGFRPRFESRYQTVDFHSVQALVANGHGLSLLPRLSLGCVRPDVAVRPLEPAPVRHLKLAFPPTSYRSPACEALLEIFQQRLPSSEQDRKDP